MLDCEMDRHTGWFAEGKNMANAQVNRQKCGSNSHEQGTGLRYPTKMGQ